MIVFASGVATGEDAGDLLQKKLNTLQSMRANFTQVIYVKQREISHSDGNMALQRPGHFRWQTKNPMAQIIVADGKKIWIYDVDLEQVTVKDQNKNLGETIGLFLSGYNEVVAHDFIVTLSTHGNAQIFNLHAKAEKENFQIVKLGFVGGALTTMELFDHLGQRTVVKFSNIKINNRISKKLFIFKPTKGVDVVT